MSRVRAAPPAGNRAAAGDEARELAGLLDGFARTTGIPFRVVLGERRPLHDSLGPGEVGPVRQEGRLPDGRELRVEVGAEGERAQAAASHLWHTARSLLAARHELRLFSRAMLEAYEQITLLTSIGDVLGSVVEVEAAAEVILGELLEVLQAGRATLWLAREDEEAPRRAAVRERMAEAAGAGLRDLEARLAARALGGRRSLVVSPSAESAGAAVVAVPVSYAPARGTHRRVGALSLVRAPGREPFAAGDLRLLEAVATQIGAAVQTGRLVQESVQRERMEAELELAHRLQLKLLPDLAGFADVAEVAARSEPVEGVGGDFYQLIRLPDDRLGVMLGDVSSHGISAALIMALTLSAASMHARGREAPAEVLGRVHGQLLRELESTEMYASLFYGVLDPAAGRLRYANAGHPHAYRLVEATAERLDALDAPLGLAGPRRYRETAVEWGAGHTLLLFTDGLTAEAGGAGRRPEEAIVAAASRAAAGGPRAVVEAVFGRAAPSGARDPRGDDRSALAVRLRLPSG